MLKNENGFSLLQVLLATVILALTSYIFVKMVTGHNKSLQKVTEQADVDAIRLHILKSIDCPKTLAANTMPCSATQNASIRNDSNLELISPSGNTVMGKYNVVAKCNNYDFSLFLKKPNETDWKDISKGIPISCPASVGLPPPPVSTANVCDEKQKDMYYDSEDLPKGYIPGNYYFFGGVNIPQGRIFSFYSSDTDFNPVWADRATTRRVISFFDGFKDPKNIPFLVEPGVCFGWENKKFTKPTTTFVFTFKGNWNFKKTPRHFLLMTPIKMNVKMKNAILIIYPMMEPGVPGTRCSNVPFDYRVDGTEKVLEYKTGAPLQVWCDYVPNHFSITVRVTVVLLKPGQPSESYFSPQGPLSVQVTKREAKFFPD